jgi:hypothetical protein
MNFNLFDSEMLFFDINRQWNETHDIAVFKHVGDILLMNPSLWHTQYGSIYKSMCYYLGYPVPISPPRVKHSKYIIVIYKRYE